MHVLGKGKNRRERMAGRTVKLQVVGGWGWVDTVMLNLLNRHTVIKFLYIQYIYSQCPVSKILCLKYKFEINAVSNINIQI